MIKKEAIRSRLKKGWTTNEALEIIPCIDPCGNSFRSYKEMCTYWEVDYELLCRRVRSGWKLEDALTFVRKKKTVADHEGTVRLRLKKHLFLYSPGLSMW